MHMIPQKETGGVRFWRFRKPHLQLGFCAEAAHEGRGAGLMGLGGT